MTLLEIGPPLLKSQTIQKIQYVLGQTLSSFVTASGAWARDVATGVASTDGRTVKFRDGTVVAALGQGTARLGTGRHLEAVEEEALRTGLSLGMTLIDTAEVYGSEEFIGRVIAGQRDQVFLVSKVWPTHVAENGIARACEESLTRLGTLGPGPLLPHPRAVSGVFRKLRPHRRREIEHCFEGNGTGLTSQTFQWTCRRNFSAGQAHLDGSHPVKIFATALTLSQVPRRRTR